MNPAKALATLGIRSTRELQTIDRAAAVRSLRTFAKKVQDTTARRRAAPGPNTAMVWPGGGIYDSIQKAIDSITDASFRKRYEVIVGRGTFQESVRCKPWVFVHGQKDASIILRQVRAGDEAPAVTGAENSSVGDLSIFVEAVGNVRATGVACDSVNLFTIDNCNIVAKSEGSNATAFGVSVNFNSAGVSIVRVSFTLVDVSSPRSTPIAIGAGANSMVEIQQCNAIASPDAAFAGAALSNARVHAFGSSFTGSFFAFSAGERADATLQDCRTSGEVSPNVKIIPKAAKLAIRKPAVAAKAKARAKSKPAAPRRTV